MVENRCINCSKEINLKTSVSYYSMRKKNEKSDYCCDDCWSKNKDQYLKDYSRIMRANYEDEENSEEWIKFIKRECQECGTGFLCESEKDQKLGWEENKCKNCNVKKDKKINHDFDNKSTSGSRTNDGEGMSGGKIALISLLVVGVLGLIGYFIWKRSKN